MTQDLALSGIQCRLVKHPHLVSGRVTRSGQDDQIAQRILGQVVKIALGAPEVAQRLVGSDLLREFANGGNRRIRIRRYPERLSDPPVARCRYLAIELHDVWQHRGERLPVSRIETC